MSANAPPVRTTGHVGNARRGVRSAAAIAVALLALAPPLVLAQRETDRTSDTTARQQRPGNSSKKRPEANTTLAPIEVTATRRREPIEEVPLRVDKVSAEDLQGIGAKILSDYVSYQPAAFFASSGGTGEGQIIMRGVSTGNQTSPTVSVYIDDVPIGGSTVYAASSTFVFDMSLMDLDHVEFLYGPQGTLYGAGSMGGLIKYVTNIPDPSAFQAAAGVDFSTTARGGFNHTENVLLNAPIGASAALRVSAFDERTTGIYDAIGATPARHADNADTRGARAQILLQPTPSLSIRLSAMGQKIDADGLSMADYNLDGTPLHGPYDRSLNKREPFHQNLELYSANVGYDFGWAHMDWINSYQDFVNDSDTDYPSNFLLLLEQVGFGLYSALYDVSYYHVHKYSQELRLTSPTGSTFDWLAGLWFTRENVWALFDFLGDNVPPPGSTLLIYQFTQSSYEEYAGYGDLTWHLTPKLDLTGGVRASGNSQRLASDETGIFAGTPGAFSESSSGDDITELLTARYKLGGGDSVYFRAATGYRPGGLQAPITDPLIEQTLSAKTTFGPDNLESYEVGYKGNAFDNRLSFDADAYHVEWHHVQLYTYDMGYTIIENAGNARVDGLELSGSFMPDEHWLLTGAIALNNARLTQDEPLIGVRAGSSLPYAAKAAGTFAAQYRFHLFDHPAFVGATERLSMHRNSGFNGDAGDPNFVLPGYGLLDLDAGVDVGGKRLGVYLRNAADRRFPMGALNVLAVNNLGGPVLVAQSMPRTFGVTLQIPFR